MELWRKVWRDGFMPQFSDSQKQRMLTALQDDDERLLQGMTTLPTPSRSFQGEPCEGACFISFAGWEEGQTVAEVEDAFAAFCFDADQRLMEPAACRYFLSWYDECPRDEMRRELISELTN